MSALSFLGFLLVFATLWNEGRKRPATGRRFASDTNCES
jgi:hypothetical protein